MVYESNLSGINDVLWSSKFVLPALINTLRYIEEGTFVTERNVGWMCWKWINMLQTRAPNEGA